MRVPAVLALAACVAMALQLAPTPAAAGSPWSTGHNRLMYNGRNVTLHGIGTTTTEYLLRGIGMKSFATYDWTDLANVITTVNEAEVSALINIIKSATTADSMPIVRIPLTASYWLGVVTTPAAGNFAKYPHLSQQYQILISELVANYTSAGVVTVLDLHWNDDATQQQAMALKTGINGQPTGGALEFWDSIATKFGSNPLVFYELYNEPHTTTDIWMHGNSQYAGMLEMAAAVQAHAPAAVLVIGGAADYAYSAASQVALDPLLPAGSNVIWNFHPYMGRAQDGDTKKCPNGWEGELQTLFAGSDRPAMATEFGQACCATQGSCENCPDTFKGQTMGYDHEIVAIAKAYGVSWMPWAWRPGAGSTGGSQCEDLNGGSDPPGLSLVHPTNGEGGDWATLWPEYGA